MLDVSLVIILLHLATNTRHGTVPGTPACAVLPQPNSDMAQHLEVALIAISWLWDA